MSSLNHHRRVLGVWVLGLLLGHVTPQVAWTPIYVDGSSQVDMWTQAVSGCACSWDSSRKDCACCVKEGACPCGKEAPNRCAQCGLEAYCSNMCNMTIDARTLRSKSGRTYGQIKSPPIEGPHTCSYRLQPAPGQRVELQLYRMVSVGQHNGTSCVGGSLKLSTIELCGVNERYDPPVVLFADYGDATLTLEVKEVTKRSQIFAYYSFTSLSNSQGVGFQPRGGTRILNTDCDWLYQDVGCRGGKSSCVAASPGYPGLYPPKTHCRYVFATSSVHTRLRLNLTNVLLPKGRCSTDYLALYRGKNATEEGLLAKICEPKSTLLEFQGPDIMLEFSTGDLVPPYDYNGFMATIEFLERALTTTTPATLNNSVDHDIGPTYPPAESNSGSGKGSRCELVISGERGSSRSGHFDTRTLPYYSECKLIFRGKTTDVVHISLFNYKLKAPSCRSVIEIVDGEWTPPYQAQVQGEKPLMKVCSPAARLARDEGGRFVGHKSIVSLGHVLTIVLRRSAQPHSTADTEFLDGAYMFHDESVAGTVHPGGLCEAQYYGLSSAPHGKLQSPASAHLFWNVEGPLKCRHQFIPAANQSITITIQSLGKVANDRHCETVCGDSGCQCRTNLVPLDQLDHLLLMYEDEHVAACLCGNFMAEWLPVALRSWSTVNLVYSVGHYTWTAKGFSFGASYRFNDDAICGHHSVTTHSGEIYSRNLSTSGSINNFYQQYCTWILDSNVERQLTIEISTNQSRPCGAWNVTIHEYLSSAEDDHHVGALLHTFCPRDTKKQINLPWRLNTVVVRVLAMTRTPPAYHIRWRSRAAVGGIAPPAAADGISGFASSGATSTTLSLFTCLLLVSFYFIALHS